MKTLLILAAAGLSLSACAQPYPARTVFLSGPGVHHISRDAVVIIREPRGSAAHGRAHAHARRHAELARRHGDEAGRTAFLFRPDPEEMARIAREARAAGEAGRRAGEAGRRAGEAGRRAGELARRQGEIARRQGAMARLHGEEARRRGAEIRQEAERLRAQCERGEIKCEIIDNAGSRTITIIR
jgi:hypothetical protein